MGGGAAAEVVRLADQALADDELLYAQGPACMSMYRAVVALLVCDELERAWAKLTLALAEGGWPRPPCSYGHRRGVAA